MRKGIRFVVVLALAGLLAAGASRVPRLLSEIEIFEVRELRLEGERYLTMDEAVRWAAVPSGASVWDEPGRWERSLRAHPMVRDARIERELPHTLVLTVEEREPVALVPTPTLEPVDAEGRSLPLDPARHRMDLPLIRPHRLHDGRRLTPGERREVAAEIARLSEIDPRFMASVSDVAVGARDHLVVRLADPGVEVRYRPPLTSRRLHRGLQALADARSRERRTPRSVDLRYDDQVVVGLSSRTSRHTD